MRFTRIVGAIGLCLCGSGCRLASDITHNMVFETCLFADDVKAKVYYPVLARSAWTDYLAQHPGQPESTDFAAGFKLGYADYLENGGDGSAGRLPPMRYWKIRNETPEGRAATQLWLAGFRAGAVAARAGGKRELIVVPIGEQASPPPLADAPPVVAPPVAPPPTPPPSSEELPKPQTLPPTSYYQTNWGQKATKTAESPRPALPSRPDETSPPPLAPPRRGPSAPSGQADPELPRIIVGRSNGSGVGGATPPLQDIGRSNGVGVGGATPLLQDLGSRGGVAPPTPVQAIGSRGGVAPPTPPPLQQIAAKVQRIQAMKTQKTPRDPEPHYRVGMIALRAGSTAEGLRWLNSALNEDPNHAPTHRALMEHYERIGDFRRAAEHRVMAEMNSQDKTSPPSP